jgi:hypothetical protein
VKNLVTAILTFFLTLSSYSQRSNIWYFGIHNGINFNTNPPSLLGGQSANYDYTSTMSDNQGNLLFYTDGISVWNKLHVIMPNGSGLVGSISAGQCALIIPIPSDPNKYVIFHVTQFANPGYLNYSVVDMSLDGGLGDVVQNKKNISLGTGWTEKICAYYNASGNNYWVVVHKDQSDQFVSFNVTSSTIATQSVVSAIGSVHYCGAGTGPHDAMGQITISPDGSKLINALTCQDKFELFDFDLLTGGLSNSISIPGNGDNAWGTAFSPDNKKLYLDGIFAQSVFQYDLTNYNQIAINASKFAVATVTASGYNFAYMELAPNGKIYVAKPNVSSLATINSPDNLGAGCNFSINGQTLTGTCQWGLSRIAFNIPPSEGTGLNHSKMIKSAMVFPNPARDIIMIEFEGPANTINNVKIIDALGKILYTWINNEMEITIPKLRLDISFLSQGLYYLQIQNETSKQKYEFLKE